MTLICFAEMVVWILISFPVAQKSNFLQRACDVGYSDLLRAVESAYRPTVFWLFIATIERFAVF